MVFHRMHRRSQTWAFLLTLFLCLFDLRAFCEPASLSMVQERRKSCWSWSEVILPVARCIIKCFWFLSKRGFQRFFCGKLLGRIVSTEAVWPHSPTKAWLDCGLMSQCASPMRTASHREGRERSVKGFLGTASKAVSHLDYRDVHFIGVLQQVPCLGIHQFQHNTMIIWCIFICDT